jgi:hypothetical protein
MVGFKLGKNQIKGKPNMLMMLSEAIYILSGCCSILGISASEGVNVNKFWYPVANRVGVL